MKEMTARELKGVLDQLGDEHLDTVVQYKGYFTTLGIYKVIAGSQPNGEGGRRDVIFLSGDHED